jgi:hypothetical protein
MSGAAVTFPGLGVSNFRMTESLCLDDLDDAALDRLPFGVVRLSPSGTVERFNRTEAERTRIQRWRALGRDYFRDVAGPTAPQLAAQVSTVAPGTCTRVFHTFRSYRRADDDAVIDVSRSDEGRVYLCIRPTSRAM